MLPISAIVFTRFVAILRDHVWALAPFVVIAVAAPMAAAVNPDATIDQHQDTIEGNATIVPGLMIGQTFTAGVSGRLSDIVITLANQSAASDPLHAVLTGVDGGGMPDLATGIASLDLQPSNVAASPTPTELHFPGTPSLSAGQTYAIVLSTTDANGYDIYGAGSIPFYTMGQAYGSLDGGISWADVGGDANFSTYMLPPLLPGRLGYCLAGQFLDLEEGQPDVDPLYAGATPAIYVEGKGVTCEPPPPSYHRKPTTDTDVYFLNKYELYGP